MMFILGSFQSAILSLAAIMFGNKAGSVIFSSHSKIRSELTCGKLSRGIDFIFHVVNGKSYDEKKTLLSLEASTPLGLVEIHDALINSIEDRFHNDMRFLEDHTEDEMSALIPQLGARDTDTGPRIAWSTLHKEETLPAIMLDNAAGLRERAYVFWDSERMERYEMLRVFDRAPADSSHAWDYTNKTAYTEMQKSFDERSRIWQSGGRGYWSEGDESRILWPTQQRST